MARIFNTVDVAPVGAWVRSDGNPVITSFYGMPENIVFDPVSSKYYSPCTNFTDASCALIESTDLVTWTVTNASLFSEPSAAASPHLLLNEGTWYLYYAKAVSTVVGIYYATASSPNGTWTHNNTALLVPTGSGWEKDRVLEPFVFQEAASPFRWIMFYMGDQFYTDPVYGANSSWESCGYAHATSPAGPWTRYASNPVIPIGAAGQFDYGGTADPHVYYFNGLYYIYYACTPLPPTIVHQFNQGFTGLYTSPDLVTFTKVGIAFRPSGVAGSYDELGVVRGGIIRKDDTYYFIYAGRKAGAGGGTTYRCCMATLSAKAPTLFL